MCLFNKETENNLVEKIVEEKIKINALNLSEKDNFNAALKALELKRSLAKDLSASKKEEKNLLIAWLKKYTNSKYDNSKIAYLNEELYISKEKHDNDIISVHLTEMLKNISSEESEEPIIHFFQSLKNELVMKFNYECKKGEEIVYLDKELSMPVYMTAKVDLTLKIVDPFAFINFVDVNIQQINSALLASKLLPLISASLRAATLGILEKNNICYYELTKYYYEIAKELQAKLQEEVSCAGIEISNTFLRNTAIPNGADKIFENQRINFMQREKDLNLRHKAEIMALENYERKAEIHKKYPNFEIGLTEKEKDLAIDRYLIKEHGRKDERFELAKESKLKERKNEIGKLAQVTNSFQEKINFKKDSSGAIASLIFGIIMFIIGFVMLGNGVSSGFFVLACAILFTGIAIAKFANNSKTIIKNDDTQTNATIEGEKNETNN